MNNKMSPREMHGFIVANAKEIVEYYFSVGQSKIATSLHFELSNTGVDSALWEMGHKDRVSNYYRSIREGKRSTYQPRKPKISEDMIFWEKLILSGKVEEYMTSFLQKTFSQLAEYKKENFELKEKLTKSLEDGRKLCHNIEIITKERDEIRKNRDQVLLQAARSALVINSENQL